MPVLTKIHLPWAPTQKSDVSSPWFWLLHPGISWKTRFCSSPEMLPLQLQWVRVGIEIWPGDICLDAFHSIAVMFWQPFLVNCVHGQMSRKTGVRFFWVMYEQSSQSWKQSTGSYPSFGQSKIHSSCLLLPLLFSLVFKAPCNRASSLLQRGLFLMLINLLSGSCFQD